MKTHQPILYAVSLILLAGLACSTLSGGTSPQATEPAAQDQPTSKPNLNPAPTSTSAPAATAKPTEPPAPAAQQFFTEEFDGGSDWTYFVVDGATSTITEEDNPNMAVLFENGLLTFDLQDEGLWVYSVYQSFEYDNVRMDARVVNRGVNNNNVSLICRLTDTGWYEFNIANNGLYWMLVASVDSDNRVAYDLIYNGGSNKIKSGKETNEYTAVCNGNELSLFINGEEARTVTESKYNLTNGLISASVSSFDTLPVTVDFEWIKISEP